MQLLSGDDLGPHSFVCSYVPDQINRNVTVDQLRQRQQPRNYDDFLTTYLRRRVAAKRRGSAGLWRSGQCDNYCAPPTATAQPQGFPRLFYLRHARFRSAVAFLPPMTSPARQNLRVSQQNAFSDAPTRAHRRVKTLAGNSPSCAQGMLVSPRECDAVRSPSSSSCGTGVVRSSAENLPHGVPPFRRRDLQHRLRDRRESPRRGAVQSVHVRTWEPGSQRLAAKYFSSRILR